MLKQIINGRILTPQGWLTGGSVVVEGTKIKAVINTDLPVEGAEIIDAKGHYVVPGGIELHIHGGGGRDFMEGTEEAFKVAVETHLMYGTTAIYPTLSSSTVPMIKDAIKTTEKMMAEDPNTPIMGLHLEGPYFNLEMAGGQIPENIRLADPAEYEEILKSTNVIKRWDAAPELHGALEFGKCCCKHGVLPSIAHTKVDYDGVVKAYEHGYTHVTHFYNAMTGFHKVREYKKAGCIEAVYDIPDMTVEMIADSIHVPTPMLRMIYKFKGVENTALITDALSCTKTRNDFAFDPRVIIEDGVCKLSDRSALAGSIATMDRLLRTCVKEANIPMEDAVRMSSESPARIMGILDRKGTLEAGKDADITMYDDDINLRYVMAMGKVWRDNIDQVDPEFVLSLIHI